MFSILSLGSQLGDEVAVEAVGDAHREFDRGHRWCREVTCVDHDHVAAVTVGVVDCRQDVALVFPGPGGHEDAQELTFVLPQLYCGRPVEQLYNANVPPENYTGPKTVRSLLPGGVAGLTEGFIGRRREQQGLPLRNRRCPARVEGGHRD